jgi:hypothetical protein
MRTHSLQNIALAVGLLLTGCSGGTTNNSSDDSGSDGSSGIAGGVTANGGLLNTGGNSLSGGSTSSGVSAGIGGTGKGGTTVSTSGTGGGQGGTMVSAGGTGGIGQSGASGVVPTGGTAAGTGGEDTGKECSVPVMPAYSALDTNDKLPDPFKMMSGSRIANKSEWACRREEIGAQAQQYELGPKPPRPTTLASSYSGNTLTITLNEGGKSMSFSVSITLPSGGTAPFPALIYLTFFTLPASAFPGVATIALNVEDIAQQDNASSRGKGKFYDLYGSSHPAGALMAWAWAVSRIIDALETAMAPAIDSTRIAVTGCSRYGKGALVAGAFDERIALTIPQESGSGGSACWRVSDAQKAAGQNVQTLSEITGENCWFTNSFSQFNNTANKLPFDHHMLEGMVAPRSMLMIENTTMEWLGNLSCFTCATAAHMIWEALGVPDNVGFSQVGGHNHCQFPASQQPELENFVKKFLLNTPADTKIMKTDGNFTFDKTKWVYWDVPSLK